MCLLCEKYVVSSNQQNKYKRGKFICAHRISIKKNLSLDLLLEDDLLLDPYTTMICSKCEFETNFESMKDIVKDLVSKKRLVERNYSDVKERASIRKIWEILTTGYTIVKDMKSKKKSVRIDDILVGNINKFKMKNDIGFKEETFWKIFKDIYNRLPDGRIEYNFHLRNNHVIQCKVRDKREIERAIYLFMSWIFHGWSDSMLAQHYGLGRYKFKRYVYMGAGLFYYYFKPYHLLNTLNKIKENQSTIMNEMLGLDPEALVLFVDGVRWKIHKTSSYKYQYLSYSEKDKYNAFNVLGIHTVTGKCVMYAPEDGNASCAKNGDSFVWDMCLLDNLDDICKLVPYNQLHGVPGGVVLIMDKGFNYSDDKHFGGHRYWLPNTSHKKKPENRDEANLGRFATMWRWTNEKCYICFALKWKFWAKPIPTCYNKIIGKLANICGSIINFTNWGINKLDYDRIKELYLMKMMFKQQTYHTAGVDYHYELLDIYRKPSVIKQCNVWLEAQTPQELFNNSVYWNRERLDRFIVRDVYKDIRLLGGGAFSVKMAMKYCYHSRKHISLYFSNVKGLETYLMIRNIKKKMSKFDVKNPSASSIKNHHVLIYLRSPDEIILNTNRKFVYPKIVLETKSTCLGRHGKRDISICGHRGAAYYFLWLWNMHIVSDGIPDPTPKATSFFSNMINTDEWVRNYYKLNNDEKFQKHMLVRMMFAVP